MCCSVNCGLAYQRFEGICKSSPEWMGFGGHAIVEPDLRIEGAQIPYILYHPLHRPELKAFTPAEDEQQSLDGFRRIQLVSQHNDLLGPLFPGLKLSEDFVHFAEMVQHVPHDLCPYLSEIQQIRTQAETYLTERDNRTPAYSSYSQMIELRRSLTKESRSMRQQIDVVLQNLCDDPSTPDLVDYIKSRRLYLKRSSYYAGVLSIMASSSKFAKSNSPKSPKPSSKDKVEWRLFDGGGNYKRRSK